MLGIVRPTDRHGLRGGPIHLSCYPTKRLSTSLGEVMSKKFHAGTDRGML